MATPDQDRVRLKRPGGPGSPQGNSSDREREGTNRDLEPPGGKTFSNNDRDPVSLQGGEEGESESATEEESPIYDIELVIYTVSGHKYSAKLNFKQDVDQGQITPEKARKMIRKVEHDIKNRTFQRPITYSDTRGGGATVEYIFNPENVECVGIVRKY